MKRILIVGAGCLGMSLAAATQIQKTIDPIQQTEIKSFQEEVFEKLEYKLNTAIIEFEEWLEDLEYQNHHLVTSDSLYSLLVISRFDYLPP